MPEAPAALAWRVVLDEPRTAAGQMAEDLRLAAAAEPVVRFFQWAPPAVSLGWKQHAPAWIHALPPAQVVERPTGGALALHGSDLSIALIVPRTPVTSLHALLTAAASSAVRLCRSYGVLAQPLWETAARTPLTYCLAEASPYAVCVGPRKVAGFAARRFPDSCLVQGSILIRPIAQALARAMPPTVTQQYARRAVPLAEAAGTPLNEHAVAQRWAEAWTTWWEAEEATPDAL